MAKSESGASCGQHRKQDAALRIRVEGSEVLCRERPRPVAYAQGHRRQGRVRRGVRTMPQCHSSAGTFKPIRRSW
jgi:hypothetical protein